MSLDFPDAVWVALSTKRIAGVNIFKIIPEFRILRLTP